MNRKVRIYADIISLFVILWSLSYDLDEWVANKNLSDWQRDILLTCGFKTVPKYNFFELLIFCVENFAKTSWLEFLQGNQDLAEEFEKYSESLRNKPMTIDETIWERFVSSQSSGQREVVNSLNLKELVQEQINQALGNWRPTEELTKETPEENISEEPPREQVRPQLSSSTSRYDNLFANLNKEEAERQRKKLEREEANRRLQEQERQRREQKLSEKDRKLKEDEERRTRERELAELEEKKRREAEQARAELLQKQQEAAFQKKQTNIEEAKRRAEENLANQIKANELAEKKKRDEIEKMEKENQTEQERLANQAKLIEEEKQKKLAAIALEDKEERQRIEKKMNEEKAEIEKEMAEKKRKNDEELKKKENALLKEKQEKQLEIDKLQKEADLQRTIAEETKKMARHREEMLKSQKNQTNRLEAHRDYLWNQVLDYYWASSEAQAGTRSPTQYSGGTLRNWLSSYPNMEFNLYRGDGRQYESANWGGYRVAMKAFYGVVGADIFVTQDRFKELLKSRVNDLSIGMD